MNTPRTVKQLLPAIGSTILVRLESLHARCIVVDAKNSYGNARLLVTPVTGKGEMWIETGRIIQESAEEKAITV